MKVHTAEPFGYKTIPGGYEIGWRQEFYDSVPSSDEFSKIELNEEIKIFFDELIKNISEDGISIKDFTLPNVLLRKEKMTRFLIAKNKKGTLNNEEILYKIATYYCSSNIKKFAIDNINQLAIKNNYYIQVNYNEDCYENIDELNNPEKQPHTINVTLYNEKRYLKLFQEELINFKDNFNKMLVAYQKGYSNISYSLLIEEASKELREIKAKFNSLLNVDLAIEEQGFRLDDRGKILVLKNK